MQIAVPSQVAPATTGGAPSERASLYPCWASSATDVRAAQGLRRSVFFDEMGARPANAHCAADALDVDHFDAFCDHLLIKVRNASNSGDDPVVGTCRVLSPEATRSL